MLSYQYSSYGRQNATARLKTVDALHATLADSSCVRVKPNAQQSRLDGLRYFLRVRQFKLICGWFFRGNDPLPPLFSPSLAVKKLVNNDHTILRTFNRKLQASVERWYRGRRPLLCGVTWGCGERTASC